MSRELVHPTSEEELARMKRAVPADDQSIFSNFGDESTSSVASVVGLMVGAQDKTPYGILERTNLDRKEVNILVDMLRLAEHGIGGEALDIPIPYIAKQVFNYCKAKISIVGPDGHGMSREEVVNIFNRFIDKLEAREAEEKKRRQAGAAG